MKERLKRYLGEFKAFAMRGNVIDMAVGIIIGAAFGKIVDSLVNDILMPPLGWMLGKVDFSQMYFVFPTLQGNSMKYPSLEAAREAGAVTVNYGMFINTIISFILVAFAVFLLIKAINKLKSAPAPAEDSQKVCPYCFTNIDKRATKCPHCTSVLPVVEVKEEVAQPQEEAQEPEEQNEISEENAKSEDDTTNDENNNEENNQ